MKLEELSEIVSEKTYHAALSLLRGTAYKNKGGIKEIIFQAAITAQNSDFPLGGLIDKITYWVDAYLDSGINLISLERCISGLDKEIINELVGQDAYEILCVECERHDSCHKA